MYFKGLTKYLEHKYITYVRNVTREKTKRRKIMTKITLDAMDGRKRGTRLQGADGKLTTIEGRKALLQQKINEHLGKINHYKKFLGENPDLQGLIDREQSKINAYEKEIRLNDFSRTGIKNKVKAYEEAMKKQGLKGKELEEQVNRYREGLKSQRREHFDKLKGENNARMEANAKPQKTGGKISKFFKNIGSKVSNFFKGKGGKVAAAVVATAAIATVVSKCTGDDKPEEVAKPVDEIPVKTEEEQSKQIVTEEPAKQPEPPKSEDDAKLNKIKAKYGDTYWGYAKRELIAEHQGEVDYKPSDKDILVRMKEIMKRNNVEMAEDEIHTEPPLIVGDEVKLKLKDEEQAAA